MVEFLVTVLSVASLGGLMIMLNQVVNNDKDGDDE